MQTSITGKKCQESSHRRSRHSLRTYRVVHSLLGFFNQQPYHPGDKLSHTLKRVSVRRFFSKTSVGGGGAAQHSTTKMVRSVGNKSSSRFCFSWTRSSLGVYVPPFSRENPALKFGRRGGGGGYIITGVILYGSFPTAVSLVCVTPLANPYPPYMENWFVCGR